MPGRFVGRTHELGHIDAAFAEVTAGRSSVTVVSGEPGIGKTRLCEEAAARAAAGGLNVVDARCWLDGGAPPLWPWQPILRQLCGDDAAGLLDADSGHDVVDPDRFARFAAVTDHLAAASARTPVCLIIDDVHAADAGTLLLLRFVARSLPRLRMAVLLSRRSGSPPGDPPGPGDTLAARLLADIEAEATPIVLRRLDLAESSALLGAHGVDDLDPDLLRTVVQVSGGNPLFLRRIAALGAHSRDAAVPDGLQVALETSLQRLDAGARRVLQAGAVLGLRPAVAEVAAVAEVTSAAVLDAVGEAATAGLVVSEGTDRFAFGHELVRATLEAGMGAAERLDVHARAAAAAGAPVAGGGHDDPPVIVPDRLARRAHHALAAAPRSVADALIAVDACRAAARSMVTSFAYEQADALLSSAMALHDGGGMPAPPGGLLVEWAQAALSCGRLAEARVRFDRAATVAELEDDPFGFAQAALGLGGHWVNEHRAPFELIRVLGLQRSALQRLPHGDEHGGDGADEGGERGERGEGRAGGLGGEALALRVRLEARLAAEAVYQGGSIEPVLAALDRARACGNPGALAEALSLGHHALLTPEHAVTRLPLADELIRVASEAGHGVLGLMGLCWRAVDLFLLGDERAVRALDDLRGRADALACQAILYIVEAIDVMRLIRAGRLEEAEAAAQRCFELGTEVGEVDTLGYLGGHLLIIRLIQDRDVELLEMAESIAGSNTLIQAEFAFRAAAVMLAAKAGADDRARAAVDRLARDGLEALPRSSTWLVGMAAVIEAAASLDDAGLAREAYDLVLPYADRPVMVSLAVACLGSAERWLGLAANTFGDVDGAVAHLERAVDANRRLGHAPFIAIVRADLAAVLRRRAGPGDLARAGELLDAAIEAGAHLEMPIRVAAWRAELAALGLPAPVSVPVPPPDPTPPPPVGARSREGVLVRQGRGWRVELDGRRAFVADLVGVRYIAKLLRHPGQQVTALALAGDGLGAGLGAGAGARSGRFGLAVEAGHELLDERARAAYAARIQELTADLGEAEADADIGRVANLRAELDMLVDQLESAVGLHDRPRRFVDRTERARTAVRKAIKRALDEIDAADPVIGQLLRSSISTGATCVYVPDPDAPVSWSV
jgi:tetratricopeptide (TPR) repeat protein